MAVVLDKGIDLLPEIAWQVILFQQDAVLECLVPALDFALDLRVIWQSALLEFYSWVQAMF